MTQPHPALVPLLSGATRDIDDPQALFASAVEHRVDGVLWSRQLQDPVLSGAVVDDLARYDLVRRSAQGRLWRALERVAARLASLDVEWMLLKGLGTQQRYYERPGERPTSDLDVLVSPRDARRVGDIVRALQPDHPLVDVAQRIVDHGDEQALEVFTEDTVVDLHVDMLKTRLPMRSADRLWASTPTVRTPGGVEVRVPDTEAALLHHVVHLNKDRFRFLLGYVDVARIAPHTDVDRFWSMASEEGIDTHVRLALDVVGHVFPLPELGLGEHPARGWRAAAWRRAWSDDVRLSGQEGITRYRHRQDLLSLTARGRTGEFLRTRTWPRLFPPAERIDQVYPGLSGPYLWRLSAGRTRAAWQRRRSRGSGHAGA